MAGGAFRIIRNILWVENMPGEVFSALRPVGIMVIAPHIGLKVPLLSAKDICEVVRKNKGPHANLSVSKTAFYYSHIK